METWNNPSCFHTCFHTTIPEDSSVTNKNNLFFMAKPLLLSICSGWSFDFWHSENQSFYSKTGERNILGFARCYMIFSNAGGLPV